jgi:CHAT domain-containing protein
MMGAFEDRAFKDLTYQHVSPLLLSCLALSGADATLAQWRQGDFPRSSSDGMLMADEIMDMILPHTLLVTLSACESGVGESRRGEGVIGLQRSFFVAGARHVLATLWQIDDAVAHDFMLRFYDLLVVKGIAPPDAFDATQRDLLLSYREKEGLGAAIYLAAPFVLTSAAK